MQKRKIVFSFNAPLMIGFSLLSLAVLGLSILTGGKTDRMLFSVYRSSLSPLFILRLFLHVLGHSGFPHYVTNIALILSLGPIVEERWGSVRVLVMFAITAVISGIFHLIFGSPSTMLMGASGIVYMLIFLASTSGTSRGEIPLTLIAVCVLYLTQEIGAGLFSQDNISHMTHIVGGLCGAFMGLFLRK